MSAPFAQEEPRKRSQGALAQLGLCVSDVLVLLGYLDSRDSVFVGGSLASGLGNRTSDIDVYVVRYNTKSSLEGQQFFVADTRIDSHDINLSELEGRVSALGDATSSASESLDVGDFVTIFRVVEGERISGPCLPDSLIHNARRLLRNGLTKVAAHRISRAFRSWVVCRNLADEDGIRGASVALVEECLFGSLVSTGIFYPNLKWNWEMLERVPDKDRITKAMTLCWRELLEARDEDHAAQVLTREMQRLGVSFSLSPKPFRPTLRSKVQVVCLKDERLVILGDTVFEASHSLCALAQLCDGHSEISEISRKVSAAYRGADVRITDDVLSGLRALHREGLIHEGMFPYDATDAVSDRSSTLMSDTSECFEPVLKPGQTLGAYLHTKSTLWRTSVEIMSIRDDLRGALAAHQGGAVYAAGRELVRLSLRLTLITLGIRFQDRHELQSLAEHWGEASRNYRTAYRLMHASPLDQHCDLEAYGRDVFELCENVIEYPDFVVDGALRIEKDHDVLFERLYGLMTLASEHGHVLPIEASIRSRAERLFGCSPDVLVGDALDGQSGDEIYAVSEDDWAVADRLQGTWGKTVQKLGFAILRPDAVYRGQVPGILKYLEQNGLVVSLSKLVWIHERIIEEMYRYTQCRLMSHEKRPMWWLTPKYYKLCEALVVLLTPKPGFDIPDVTEKLALLKGPSNPFLTEPGQIRHDFDSQNIVMCVIHSSENTRSMLREASLFFGHDEIASVIENPISGSQRQSQGMQDAMGKFGEKHSPSFFEVMGDIQVRILNELWDRDRFSPSGVHARQLAEEVSKVIPTLRNTLQYAERNGVMSRLWSRLKTQARQWPSSAIAKNPEIKALVELLAITSDDKRFFEVLGDRLIDRLAARGIGTDSWQKTILETGLAFHQLQLQGFKPNEPNSSGLIS